MLILVGSIQMMMMCIYEANWIGRKWELINVPFIVVPLLILCVHQLNLIRDVADGDGQEANEERKDEAASWWHHRLDYRETTVDMVCMQYAMARECELRIRLAWEMKDKDSWRSLAPLCAAKRTHRSSQLIACGQWLPFRPLLARYNSASRWQIVTAAMPMQQ